MPDQVQQPGLDLRADPRRNQLIIQAQRSFPWCRCNITACSVTVARSRPTSLRAWASSAASADWPGRPGTAADRASSAPRFAVRQIWATVERSTSHFSAASRWVACWVSTSTNTSYFSLGASRFSGRGARLGEGPDFGSDIGSILLKGDQLTRQVAGYFFRVLVHELRRTKAGLRPGPGPFRPDWSDPPRPQDPVAQARPLRRLSGPAAGRQAPAILHQPGHRPRPGRRELRRRL